jgi:hypothetical protein
MIGIEEGRPGMYSTYIASQCQWVLYLTRYRVFDHLWMHFASFWSNMRTKIIGTPSKSPLSFMGTAQRAYLSRKIERTSYVTHKFMEPGAKLRSCWPVRHPYMCPNFCLRQKKQMKKRMRSGWLTLMPSSWQTSWREILLLSQPCISHSCLLLHTKAAG